MKIDISSNIEILVFTGPESSGKTTCAIKISEEYQLPLVSEYAREYLMNYGSDYTIEDIRNIAEKQMELEKLAHKANPLIICDTDIITLEIWALEKFGTSLVPVDNLAEKKHYLLCYPDIPWEPDPLRENPEDRLRLYERYKNYLIELNLPYSILNREKRSSLQLVV